MCTPLGSRLNVHLDGEHPVAKALVEPVGARPVHVVRSDHGAPDPLRSRPRQQRLYKPASDSPFAVVEVNEDLVNMQESFALRLEQRVLLHRSRGVSYDDLLMLADQEVSSIEPGPEPLVAFLQPGISHRTAFGHPELRQAHDGGKIPGSSRPDIITISPLPAHATIDCPHPGFAHYQTCLKGIREYCRNGLDASGHLVDSNRYTE